MMQRRINGFFVMFIVAGASTIALAIACSSPPDTSARVDPIGPDRPSFEPVARVLVRKCGTLDCHGEVHRNFRLYGYGGLRLPEPDGAIPVPDFGDGGIQPTEVDADYDAVIDVEPEIMRQVVLDKGANPERLTLVRKARGTEQHKGNAPITKGDNADTCLVTWLASAVNTTACTAVLGETNSNKN